MARWLGDDVVVVLLTGCLFAIVGNHVYIRCLIRYSFELEYKAGTSPAPLTNSCQESYYILHHFNFQQLLIEHESSRWLINALLPDFF